MRLPALLPALAVGAALVVAPVASAQAAASVTIQTIPTTTVKFDATKTFKPKYVKAKNVKVDKAVLRVVRGTTVVADDAPSVKLGKGTYSVRQTVTYRTFTQTGTKTSEPADLAEGATTSADCYVTSVTPNEVDDSGTFVAKCEARSSDERVSYANAFNASGTYVRSSGGGQVYFDGFTSEDDGHRYTTESSDGSPSGASFTGVKVTTDRVVNGTRTFAEPQPVYEYSAAKTVSKSQKLTVKSLKEPKGCGSIAEYRSIKVGQSSSTGAGTGDKIATVASKVDNRGKRLGTFGSGSVTYEIRRYKACSADTVIDLLFANGKAADKYRGPASKSPATS
ncbi:MAG: hypothetical protein PGN07_07675 [Aeromicrobium erythreum]